MRSLQSVSLFAAMALVFAATWLLTPTAPRAVAAGPLVRAPAPPAAPVYYSGCNAVRAAGAAPLYRGQPGYREEMDGDDDGIACEPHRHDW